MLNSIFYHFVYLYIVMCTYNLNKESFMNLILNIEKHP